MHVSHCRQTKPSHLNKFEVRCHGTENNVTRPRNGLLSIFGLRWGYQRLKPVTSLGVTQETLQRSLLISVRSLVVYPRLILGVLGALISRFTSLKPS